jgi:type I restriction enzyme M protein
VPEGVLFSGSKAHKDIRKLIVNGHQLDAVVKLPSGVFKPYSGVSTAILLFRRTDSGGTSQVWFYEVSADGFSLDQDREPLLAEGKRGPSPVDSLTEEDHAKNNLPDVLARWTKRNTSELERPRTEQSFCVPLAEIQAAGYDLSMNRYKEVVHQVVAYRAPAEILAELDRIEAEIQQGISDLKGMLG